MTEPLRISGLWAKTESVAGTFESLAAGDALKLDATATPPEEQPNQGSTARPLAAVRADYGGDEPASGRYQSVTLPAMRVAYGWDGTALASDAAPREARWYKAAGYTETLNAGVEPLGSAVYVLSGSPNSAAGGLSSLSVRMEAGPFDDADGMRWDMNGVRCSLQWQWGGGLPLRVVPTCMGGWITPIKIAAGTARTFTYPPLVIEPLSVQLVETDYRNAATSNAYTNLSFPSGGSIFSAYAPEMQEEFSAHGYLVPPLMSAGRPRLETTIMYRPEDDLPLEKWKTEAKWYRLRVQLTWDDATQGAADGGVHRHTLRFGAIRSLGTPQPGPGGALTRAITLEFSSDEDATLPAHEFAYAAVVANLPVLSDDV